MLELDDDHLWCSYIVSYIVRYIVSHVESYSALYIVPYTIPYGALTVCHTIHRIVNQTNATEMFQILHYLFESTLQGGFAINDNAGAGR